ncbi:alpha/beta fold hydrolase [Saccharospirillum sp. HFRX-1]|uniref:alpha/beta fold hydrolase n=1 Tax=unclassified Saccharospirillum TaxID=2633430 RepID=UPI003711E728
MTLSIKTLGDLAISSDGQPLELPQSKRTRALIAYLAVAARPHRRDRLCEIFWKLPDDPRSALRWSLSKIRPLVNAGGKNRLVADRERVSLLTYDMLIDIRDIEMKANDPFTSPKELEAMHTTLQEVFLEGLDLPDQELFQHWLTAQRRVVAQLRAKVMFRLSSHPELPPSMQLYWARLWEELEPYNPSAATRLITLLESIGLTRELSSLTVRLTKRFQSTGINWSPKRRSGNPIGIGSDHPKAAIDESSLDSRQKIQFCTTDDDVRIAYASVGNGPTIVKAANWLNHLEHDWDAPIWSPLFRDLAADHRFIRYDERGCGLSDWKVEDLSFDAFLKDLEAVVNASGADRFVLLGISQGAALSIAYAVAHPERVSHLILFGGYARGGGLTTNAELKREREAVVTLTEMGWSRDNPAYRQIFSSTFIPSASASEVAWFNDFQRATTSPENAARFLSIFDHINIQELLPLVTVPTLVIHSRDDQRVPVKDGLDLAAKIPNAEFVGLSSDSHSLLGREPASTGFLQAVRDFLARNPD